MKKIKIKYRPIELKKAIPKAPRLKVPPPKVEKDAKKEASKYGCRGKKK